MDFSGLKLGYFYTLNNGIDIETRMFYQYCLASFKETYYQDWRCELHLIWYLLGMAIYLHIFM